MKQRQLIATGRVKSGKVEMVEVGQPRYCPLYTSCERITEVYTDYNLNMSQVVRECDDICRRCQSAGVSHG